MILIADGGSTKVDWIVLNKNKKELLRTQTLGLNPAVVDQHILKDRIQQCADLIGIKTEITTIHFYGAGCGTPEPIKKLNKIFQSIFSNAKIFIAEDMLGAVHASAETEKSIVCILGTGSNSCYFDGKEIISNIPSLGYSIMDEASGNYFGKQLLRDYFYNRMPNQIKFEFENTYNLTPDFIKLNLYQEPNPNRYLASLAKIMAKFKNEEYIYNLVFNGFEEFFKSRILTFQESSEVPVHFIGSIAYFFKDILETVAQKNHITIGNVIQRPIDNLVAYHIKQMG